MKRLLICIIILISIKVRASPLVDDLNTPEEHAQFIKSALQSTQSEIIIISPFISIYRLQDDGNNSIESHIQQAIQRGVSVIVITDDKLDKEKTGEPKHNARMGRERLKNMGVNLKIAPQIHTKNIIVDNTCFTNGSFNWLSAVADKNSDWCRLETTCVRRGQDLSATIDAFKLALFKIPVERPELQQNTIKLEAEQDVEAAINLYIKLYSHRDFSNLVTSILYAHVDYFNETNKNLKILKLLEKTAHPTYLVSTASYLLRFASNRLEILDIVEYMTKHDQNAAKEAARNLLSSSNRSEDYDRFDSMYARLKFLNMNDIGDDLEKILIFGENIEKK